MTSRLALSALWIYENALIPHSDVCDVVRFAFCSKEHLAAFQQHVRRRLRVTVSRIAADPSPLDDVCASLLDPRVNIVLDCVSTLSECWKLAATQGLIGFVRMLDRHRVPGCDLGVLAVAIAAHHAPLVLYLHDARPELFTPETAAQAAAQGDVGVLASILSPDPPDSDQTLINPHDRDIDAAVVAAFRSAAQAGQTRVMQWLYDTHRIPGWCGAAALKAAADSAQVEAVIWIFENVADAKLAWLSRRSDRTKVRDWLERYGSFELGSSPPALYFLL